ncbi:hypothetical protein EGW08_020051 [Elysia chlorotica]|uniref:Sulfotransferase domain-containing protein n=1 Tax=Elysia chlorotica TaxID=188477 RepID=A0A3S0Z938_ELYCH|nr:hypothetical protein EGW08_020051 [Elysia chlorotica]
MRQEGDLGEDTIIIYNRVPKTGSTSFLGIMDQLCKMNDFHTAHFYISRYMRVLGLADQRRFITKITNWEKMKPALYHGHAAFMDFSKFGVKQLPIYINMVRDPLERLISHYYFLRYGDDFDPERVKKRALDLTTFDECVERDGEDCGPNMVWVQIPFFCGHHPECWEPGNEWALEEAKRNLRDRYLVVGITEEFPHFLAVLEAALPRMFHGAQAIYNKNSQSRLRRTANKLPPSAKTLNKMEESPAYRLERDFYRYAVKQFHFVKQHSIGMDSNNQPVIKPKLFGFDKFRGK